MFSLRADWLSASVGDISGRIVNVSGGVNLRVLEHFGVGLNYQFFELDVSIKEDIWRGELNNTYTGPFLYLVGYWSY